MDGTGETKLRRADPGDAPALARLHVKVWRETYRDIAPKPAFDQLDEARRLAYWTSFLEGRGPAAGAFVAEADGGATGLVAWGPGSAPAFRDLIEVKHLYVDAAARGHGLGRRLLSAAFAAIRGAGAAKAGLAVVEENRAARAFYRAAGGVEGARFEDAGPLWRSRNVAVVWDPIPTA